MMSLLVVINGPVAKAGSMPYLFRIIGINVPINDAVIITETNEMATMLTICIEKPKIK